MTLPRFIDEVNRLFDELVRDPWVRRLPPPQQRETASGNREVEFRMPVAEGARGNVSVALEGHTLIVTLHQHASSEEERRASVTHTQAATQHRFQLPPDTDVAGVTMWFEDSMLHVRATLRTRR